MGTVLVTGGAGFIGSHLVDRLLERGASVRVLDDLSTGSLRNLQWAADGSGVPGVPNGAAVTGRRLELMIGDVRDERLVRKAMQHAEYVFHLAALPASLSSLAKAGDLHSVNVHGTLNVLQAATAEGVRRVVFASCASVYGAAGSMPISEDMFPQPESVFGASKLAGEVYCNTFGRVHNIGVVLLRYFHVYGPRQKPAADGTLVPTLIEQLRHHRRPTIAGDARATQDLLYVDDAVEATLAAVSAPDAVGRAINIASGQMASTIEVLDVLNRLLRTEGGPRLVRARGGHATAPRAEIMLAKQILGCTPRVSLVTGLARVVEARHIDEDGLLAELGSREERTHL